MFRLCHFDVFSVTIIREFFRLEKKQTLKWVLQVLKLENKTNVC